MYSIWNFFITRRSFTIFTMVTLLIVGIFAITAMPKESAPEVVLPIGIVTTVLPGATAADVERLVTDELEPAVRNVANIDEVTSVSKQGVSMITAEFIASADIDTSIQDLRNAIESARADLPSDAQTPVVTKVDFQNEPIMMIGIGSDLAPETLTQLGKDLEDNLVALSGVSKVEVSGTRDRQISIIAHKDALLQHNIRVEHIIGALNSSNTSLPVGNLSINGVDYPVQFEGAVADVETIKNIPINTPSGTVKVSEVATVIDGFAKTNSISRLNLDGENTQYALSLYVYKASGENILAVADRVEERLSELENTLLSGSSANVTYSSADDVRTSITELTISGTQTIILVTLFLFIAIGLREALVAALAIPFSFMIAFIGMLLTGNTINFVSLFSLIIAIGILVDSGIVIVEGIHTNRENGMRKLAAARKAVHDFGWPLIAGTMTTVAVFVPLFFLSGVIGQFVKSIPFTIVVVLVASIVVTLGFVPTIALGLIRHEENEMAKRREKLWEKLAQAYRVRMEKLFNSKRLQRLFAGILALSFVLAFALPLTGALTVSMFPPDDLDLFYVEIEMPQATTLEETDLATQKVEKILVDTPYLESLMTTVGTQSSFNANSAGANNKYANITVNLDEERDLTSLEITNIVRDKIDVVDFGLAKVSVMDAEGGPPSGAPIVVKIWGNDNTALASATEQITKLVEETVGTTNVASSLQNDGTEIAVNIDREKASEYGLFASDIASTLRAAITGAEATKVRINGEDIEVRVLFDLNSNFVNPEDTNIASADDIATIPIATSRGTIPLGSLITITAGRNASVINHENGQRISNVTAYVSEGYNAVELTSEIESAAADLDLPNVQLTFGGDDEEIKKTFGEMLLALGAGLVLMFAVLVLEFDSFRTSGRLLSAVPLSLTGVLWGLWLMGQPLSFTAFLGIIALAGVLINHGILLLDAMHKTEQDNPDISAEDLVLDTASKRVRPIILTTITTVVGMVPLTFVSSMWAPLAFTIAFGLMYGTVLTLIYIPLLSYRYESKKRA